MGLGNILVVDERHGRVHRSKYVLSMSQHDNECNLVSTLRQGTEGTSLCAEVCNMCTYKNAEWLGEAVQHPLRS